MTVNQSLHAAISLSLIHEVSILQRPFYMSEGDG